jgi:2-octaprenylphenol hydroxylase
MDQHHNITLLYPHRVEALDIPNHALILGEGSQLHASLIVAADGRDSAVRTMAAIEVQGWAYDQYALVATVTPSAPHQETAWQRFMPNGPLAFLPINDGSCSIVWSTTPDEAKRLKQLPEDEFCLLLSRAIEGRLGEITHVGPRGFFPLKLQHATSYVKPGLALVGDAAHAIHPLAGQGVNLGLQDAATLAQCLIEGKQAGRSPGTLRDLRRYERIRKGDNITMLAAMDGFKRLFSNRNPVLQLLRGTGLHLANRIGPINHLFMQQALGLQGERPPLCRRPRTLP